MRFVVASLSTWISCDDVDLSDLRLLQASKYRSMGAKNTMVALKRLILYLFLSVFLSGSNFGAEASDLYLSQKIIHFESLRITLLSPGDLIKIYEMPKGENPGTRNSEYYQYIGPDPLNEVVVSWVRLENNSVNLRGGVDSIMNSITSTAGNTSLTYDIQNTEVSGLEGVKAIGRFRSPGRQTAVTGVVFGKNQQAWAIFVFYKAEDASARMASEKILDSINIQY